MGTDMRERLQIGSSIFKISDEIKNNKYSQEYSEGKPFPHIVIDDFVAEDVRKQDVEFPALDWSGWSQFDDRYQFGKRTCNELDKFPPALKAMAIEASQPRFLRFLEQVTRIDKLIPDPYLEGGGLHSSGPGGVLIPHTDFHIYEDLNLYRRVNLLIYFNENWTEASGGALELSEKGAATPEKTILPIFGRAVIFNTDDISVHGFSKPVAAGLRRNSLAFYYYTSQEVGTFSGDRTTHWQHHGSRSGLRSIRILAYKALIFGSRLFSKLAHMANPNIGKSAKGAGADLGEV